MQHFSELVLAPAGAAVKFAFGCNRCGNCCSNQSGYVWIEEGEIAPMAAALSMTREMFIKRHVRSVDGRLSLTEVGGKCTLLEGRDHCTVYTARPRQCKQFPFWDRLLGGGPDYEHARALCPGIFEVPPATRRAAAYAELKELYQQADRRIAALTPKCELSGRCCDFPNWGHQLFATILETDFAAEYGPGGTKSGDIRPGAAGGVLHSPGVAEQADWCAFYHQKRCHARETRPLACRTFFCDPDTTAPLLDLHEELLAEVRTVAHRHGYPEGYGDFVALLPARRAAIQLLDEGNRE